MSVTDETASRLLLQVVVTILQFHHPRAHETGMTVVRAVRELGPRAQRPEWARPIAAYDAVARALAEHMHEEEETILDRVQILYAQKRLLAGAMSRSKPSFDDMIKEHAEQRDLLAVLESHLAAIVALDGEDPAAKQVRGALSAFADALHAHLTFEDDALVPAAAPFLFIP